MNLDSRSENDLSHSRGAVPFLPTQIIVTFRKSTFHKQTRYFKEKWAERCFKDLYLFLFYAHWCFACMYDCVRAVSDPLELEPRTVVSCQEGARN